MRRIVGFFFIACLAMVLAAIVIQDFTDAMPMGLFNTGRGVYTVLSRLCLGLAVGAIVVLAINAAKGTLCKLSGFVRGVIVFAVVLELCVMVADVTLMSRSPDDPLGGPYYEEQAASGDWLILRKHGGESPFGFRTNEPHTLDKGDRLRLLFLGDSYTEGSGRRSECNYPTVVERELAGLLGREVEVINAGVSGYGPRQALILLREMMARGYEFDAVVYNLLTENDFTDDLPGTQRRAVAGMGFRFPRSVFVRIFHPLNSRTFRSAMFLRGFIRIRYELNDFSAIQPGPCDLDGEPIGELPETLRDITTRKRDDAARVFSSNEVLYRGVVGNLLEMQREARTLGIPFVTVVFPNRLSVDTELRGLLGEDNETLQGVAHLHRVITTFGDVDIIDTAPALEGRTGLYRRVDTHLSDLGNVVAGEWVANRLMEFVE